MLCIFVFVLSNCVSSLVPRILVPVYVVAVKVYVLISSMHHDYAHCRFKFFSRFQQIILPIECSFQYVQVLNSISYSWIGG
jgi:hypothetical protein